MQNLQRCCCKHDGKYLWKKQPIYLSLLTCLNFHLLVSESIQISNWCEPDPLTNWLVGWLLVCMFVCWPSRFDNSTVPTLRVSSFFQCVEFSDFNALSFTSSNTQVLGKFRGGGGGDDASSHSWSMAMVLLIICILMNSTTTLGTKFKLISNSIARHNMMHFWSDRIFFTDVVS
jgi:hypothetical protein